MIYIYFLFTGIFAINEQLSNDMSSLDDKFDDSGNVKPNYMSHKPISFKCGLNSNCNERRSWKDVKWMGEKTV